MKIEPAVCYAALRARDRRFDGRFFTGVRTTGVYCRPVCPARTPKPANIVFFACAAAAEEAGFRPCRRCRPETAPGTPAWNGTSTTVSRALRLIAQGIFDESNVEDLASRVGVGGRHLRRLFVQHLGASPIAVLRTQRLHLARRLIDETDLPMTEVAFAAGFQSVRRFNHAIRESFLDSPTALRRKSARARGRGTGLTMHLAYRPPLDWSTLLDFLRLRAIPGVEAVDGNAYRRSIEIDGEPGVIEVVPDHGRARLRIHMRLPGGGRLAQVVEGIRRIFDLAADPAPIAEHLRGDPILRGAVHAAPGLRVPGAWDSFELTVRAVLGQQITVRAATTLAGRLAERFGEPLGEIDGSGITHLFPAPARLRNADLRGIGLTAARAEAIRGIAEAACRGALPIDGSAGLDRTIARLCALPGIGPWTAQYIAMRALGEPDAFPFGDLGLRRAVSHGNGLVSAAQLEEMSERWRPWRAYAAMYLWTARAASTERCPPHACVEGTRPAAP